MCHDLDIEETESDNATNETGGVRADYIEGDGTKMQIYVRSMGKLLAVTALFDSDEKANAYCETHRDEGIVASCGHISFAANLYDHGTRAELPKSTDKKKVYIQ